jgi:rhodanese-related sulfurtransferase
MMALLMGLKTISPADLLQKVRAGQVATFDVNFAQSWADAHVPGATHLEPLSYAASDLPPERSSLLVFYCSNPWCRKAPNAARRALSLGYQNVRVMSAGISGWLAENLPIESAAQRAPANGSAGTE